MKYVAICSVVVVIAMFAYLVNESKMLSYMSSEPEVCINCHTMNTHYATWQHSSHRAEATAPAAVAPRHQMPSRITGRRPRRSMLDPIHGRIAIATRAVAMATPAMEPTRLGRASACRSSDSART